MEPEGSTVYNIREHEHLRIFYPPEWNWVVISNLGILTWLHSVMSPNLHL